MHCRLIRGLQFITASAREHMQTTLRCMYEERQLRSPGVQQPEVARHSSHWTIVVNLMYKHSPKDSTPLGIKGWAEREYHKVSRCGTLAAWLQAFLQGVRIHEVELRVHYSSAVVALLRVGIGAEIVRPSAGIRNMICSLVLGDVLVHPNQHRHGEHHSCSQCLHSDPSRFLPSSCRASRQRLCMLVLMENLGRGVVDMGSCGTYYHSSPHH
jgi:hypothetical protein